VTGCIDLLDDRQNLFNKSELTYFPQHSAWIRLLVGVNILRFNGIVLLVVDNIPVDSETFHRGRVCARAFIGVSVVHMLYECLCN